MELIEVLFCEVNPIPVKRALNLMGFAAGIPRMPLTELEEANRRRLEQAMKAYGILEAVLTMVQGLSYVDGSRIVLLGESQGGAVSAVTSAVHQDEGAGLILLYPAFVMADDTRKEFDSLEDIPETYILMGMTVGRRYAEDLLDYNFYVVIGQYDKDVLLLHGDSDRIVPVSYSERAVQVYPSAQLEIFSGSGHGFYGSDVEKASDYILGYLKEHFGQ